MPAPVRLPRWKQHNVDDIVQVLERADALAEQGMSSVQIARALGISKATYFRWRRDFGGLRKKHLVHIRSLEAEVQRLRKMLEQDEGG